MVVTRGQSKQTAPTATATATASKEGRDGPVTRSKAVATVESKWTPTEREVAMILVEMKGRTLNFSTSTHEKSHSRPRRACANY